MNVADLLIRSAAQGPSRPAVYLGTSLFCDYGALVQRASALGAALRRNHELDAGARVVLYMSNHPSVLEVMFGCWWAGLVVVPVNPKLHLRELDYIVSHSQASVAFTTPDIGKALAEEGSASPAHCRFIDVGSDYYQRLLGAQPLSRPVERASDDLAWLFYTSGTTGRPKGVMLSHRNLLTMVLCYCADVDKPMPADASLYAAPMSHGAGLYGLPYVAAGARHVIPESRGFDAEEILRLARFHGDVQIFAAPTMVRRLVEHAESTGSSGNGLKTIVYGGGPMYVEDMQRALKVLGPRFVQIYGQGESPMTITALARHHIADAGHPRHLERLGSVGTAQSAVQVRVVDAAGVELPFGQVGEVVVRGDTVMRGYWNDAKATAEAVHDGWLFTGDMGSFDEEGFLTLRDRSKDVIISGGSNIYPREVEEALLRHPGVAEVSAVGRPDREWGEILVAFVVARPGHSLDDLMLSKTCNAHIARFKRPKEYRFVETLPKNHYGKVLKTELRARLEAELIEHPATK
jgi:long-chain acyl-CoA synthetase